MSQFAWIYALPWLHDGRCPSCLTVDVLGPVRLAWPCNQEPAWELGTSSLSYSDLYFSAFWSVLQRGEVSLLSLWDVINGTDTITSRQEMGFLTLKVYCTVSQWQNWAHKHCLPNFIFFCCILWGQCILSFPLLVCFFFPFSVFNLLQELGLLALPKSQKFLWEKLHHIFGLGPTELF